MTARPNRHDAHFVRAYLSDLDAIHGAISDEQAETLWELRRKERALNEITAAALTTLQTELATVAFQISLKDYPQQCIAKAIEAASAHAHSLLRLFNLAKARETVSIIDLASEIVSYLDQARLALGQGADAGYHVGKALERILAAREER